MLHSEDYTGCSTFAEALVFEVSPLPYHGHLRRKAAPIQAGCEQRQRRRLQGQQDKSARQPRDSSACLSKMARQEC